MDSLEELIVGKTTGKDFWLLLWNPEQSKILDCLEGN